MSIYGFYSTNLVLRRPETSATDKSHFCSFDAHTHCVFVIVLCTPPDRIPSAARSDSVRRPIGFRSPSDWIAFAVRRKSKKKASYLNGL